ncbi:MAG: protein-export chaperone SecB [Nitrosomonadales bacterium]|nr:protein-export chaperone SecB [Nitrosomonadales bacterium]
MSNIQHPIQLERVMFTRSIVIAIPDHQPGNLAQKIPGPANAINLVPIDGQEGKYQVSMSSKFNIDGDIAYPYITDMECIGVFSVDAKLSKEEAIRGVMITAHSVLYGAIREAVAWITGRQPFGQLMLGLSVLPASQSEAPKE